MTAGAHGCAWIFSSRNLYDYYCFETGLWRVTHDLVNQDHRMETSIQSCSIAQTTLVSASKGKKDVKIKQTNQHYIFVSFCIVR